MNSFPFTNPPRMNGNAFPPFDPNFPMAGSNFFPADDPFPPSTGHSKKRKNNTHGGAMNFDPFSSSSAAFPPGPPPSSSNPYGDPYGAYRQNMNPTGINSFPFTQPQFGAGAPMFPSSTSSSGKKRKNNGGRAPAPFPPLSQIGSPVSSASFGVPPGPIFEPPKKTKSSGKKKSSSSASGKKPEGKKMRRRRDVDWRVRNDQQAYQKVLRNRQAAARSNEKRRRVRQQYDNEIGGLLDQKEKLSKKEKQLKEENQSLRAKLKRKF